MYRRRRQVATGLMGVQTHDDREALTKQLVKATHIKGSDKGSFAGRATEATLLATAGAEHPSSRDVPRWEACLPFTDVKQRTVDEARNAFLFISDLYEEPPSIFGVHDVVTAMNIPAELAVEVSESVEHLEVRVVPVSVPGADAGDAGEAGEAGEDGEVEGSSAGSRAVSMVGHVSMQPGQPRYAPASQPSQASQANRTYDDAVASWIGTKWTLLPPLSSHPNPPLAQRRPLVSQCPAGNVFHSVPTPAGNGVQLDPILTVLCSSSASHTHNPLFRRANAHSLASLTVHVSPVPAGNGT